MAVLVVLALLPFSAVDIPVLLDGPVNSPGSLQLFALCLLFAGLTLSYDLMFGRTGLLSFGHALYVAGGAYGTQLAMTHLGLALLPAALLTLAAGTVPAVLIGAASLRSVALGYLALVAAVVWTAVSRPVGRTWQGIRDNEQRIAVLGRSPFAYKLAAFTLASALAVLGGALHLLITAGATPRTSTPDFTLTLLVMVVLGGSGTRWGPVIGGVLFTYLDQRLPAWDLGLEPMLVLGTLFVVAVYAAPGGLAALKRRKRRTT
ncbi:branched-chain amino acid ABC transporter permease [Streptomyces sp. NPDC048623]|uniref:branched-chain amino acid ABC transporter permease n=1 Tax=Streptomyces sp. NPDC048623 TaxID=3155761 RepID=UPI0034137940